MLVNSSARMLLTERSWELDAALMTLGERKDLNNIAEEEFIGLRGDPPGPNFNVFMRLECRTTDSDKVGCQTGKRYKSSV